MEDSCESYETSPDTSLFAEEDCDSDVSEQSLWEQFTVWVHDLFSPTETVSSTITNKDDFDTRVTTEGE